MDVNVIARELQQRQWAPDGAEIELAAGLYRAREAVGLWPPPEVLPAPYEPPGSTWTPAPWLLQHLAWTAAVAAAADRVLAADHAVPADSRMRVLISAYAGAGRPVVPFADAAVAAWHATPPELPTPGATDGRPLASTRPEIAHTQAVYAAMTAWQDAHLPEGAEDAADRAARRMMAVGGVIHAAVTGDVDP